MSNWNYDKAVDSKGNAITIQPEKPVNSEGSSFMDMVGGIAILIAVLMFAFTLWDVRLSIRNKGVMSVLKNIGITFRIFIFGVLCMAPFDIIMGAIHFVISW